MYSPNKQTAIAILALIFFAVPTISFGQASVPQNSPQQSTDFLGWEQSVQFPLNINHKGEFPIIFSTANSEHMRLTYKGQLLMGIVATTSNAKLDIKAGSDKIGLRAHATGSNVNNYGGWFTGNSGTGANYAVYGEAISFSSGSNYGVAGRACNAANNYAVYGVTCDTTGQNWAGYFDGKAYRSPCFWI